MSRTWCCLSAGLSGEPRGRHGVPVEVVMKNIRAARVSSKL